MPDPQRIMEAERQLADAVAVLLQEGESPEYIRDDVESAISNAEAENDPKPSE